MKKTSVRIRENSWLARKAAHRLGYTDVAMVLGRTIHLHNTTRERFFARPSWVLHELKHVEQYQKLGLLKFLWQYLWEYRKVGYFNNRFEIEARAAETETTLLERYEII